MNKYYDLDPPPKSEPNESQNYGENKLNMIAKFHNKQLKKV